MIILYIYAGFIALIFLWFFGNYYRESRLEKLRKYDRKSKASAMREKRIRIDHD